MDIKALPFRSSLEQFQKQAVWVTFARHSSTMANLEIIDELLYGDTSGLDLGFQQSDADGFALMHWN